jgi:small GTP-binding protein
MGTVRLADTVGRWMGRVEVVLGGGEGLLREGEEALAAGDSSRARSAAHEILARVPGSPVGLALLADACEMGGLEGEYAAALEELAVRAPSRADVWVRLGRARLRMRHEGNDAGEPTATDDARDAFVRALAVAEAGSDERREALIALADWDLAHGEPERAELWLERVIDGGSNRGADVALRRAEVKLARSDGPGAMADLARVEIEPSDGRANLALGRARAIAGSAEAFAPLLRATIVDAPGASEALSSALGWIACDESTRARVRSVVDARGESALARWRAAFARAEGRRDEARAALVDAVRAGEAGAARPLLDAALDDRDDAALAVAVGALPPDNDPPLRDARTLAALEPNAESVAILEPLTTLSTPRAIAWAGALRASLALAWIPAAGPARWDLLLARFEVLARALHDLDASARLASLSAERRRPLRVAVVGEFNAGKSTFINAVVGQEIAPMGVLPTTATLHHLRYAPDPIARVLFHAASQAGDGPPERIVPVGDLRAVLKAIDASEVRRVEILLPIVSLTRVEILDTPGFNAPDGRHTEAARRAFDEADAAIWLLDAAQPMKKSEREVLDEAHAARLPVQVLVNKVDRLAEADRARVLAAVNEGLTESRLTSWTPPLAFSARLALAGKLGDAAALAASGWAEVEAMLERDLIARSDELKERALRRRALSIVAAMGTVAAHEADQERERDEARRARSEAVAHAAARIDRDAETIAARIAEGLARAGAAWHADLALVVAGRDPESLAADASLARYRVDRALAHLARPLAHALAGAADGTGITPADLAPTARASVRAFAAAARDSASLLPLARSTLASLVEHLTSTAAVPPPPQRASGLVGELSAFAEALGTDTAREASLAAPAPHMD